MDSLQLSKKIAVTVRIDPERKHWVEEMAKRTKRDQSRVWDQMFIKCSAMPEEDFWTDPKSRARH